MQDPMHLTPPPPEPSQPAVSAAGTIGIAGTATDATAVVSLLELEGQPVEPPAAAHALEDGLEHGGVPNCIAPHDGMHPKSPALSFSSSREFVDENHGASEGDSGSVEPGDRAQPGRAQVGKKVEVMEQHHQSMAHHREDSHEVASTESSPSGSAICSFLVDFKPAVDGTDGTSAASDAGKKEKRVRLPARNIADDQSFRVQKRARKTFAVGDKVEAR
jgi:hypothetical protein